MNLGKVIESYDGMIHKSNGATPKEILDIETTLNLKFGDEYKSYLNSYGNISFLGAEIYGYISKESGELSVLNNTLNEDELLGKGYFVIMNIGNGDLALLDNHDNVYFYYHEIDKIVSQNIKFNEYVIELLKKNLKEM